MSEKRLNCWSSLENDIGSSLKINAKQIQVGYVQFRDPTLMIYGNLLLPVKESKKDAEERRILQFMRRRNTSEDDGNSDGMDVNMDTGQEQKQEQKQ